MSDENGLIEARLTRLEKLLAKILKNEKKGCKPKLRRPKGESPQPQNRDPRNLNTR